MKTIQIRSAFQSFNAIALLILLSTNAHSSTKEFIGSITFTGSVVYGTCLVHQEEQEDLRFGCLDDKSNLKTDYVDIKTLTYTTQKKKLSNQQVSYEFRWLGDDHQRGLVKISYQ